MSEFNYDTDALIVGLGGLKPIDIISVELATDAGPIEVEMARVRAITVDGAQGGLVASREVLLPLDAVTSLAISIAEADETEASSLVNELDSDDDE